MKNSTIAISVGALLFFSASQVSCNSNNAQSSSAQAPNGSHHRQTWSDSSSPGAESLSMGTHNGQGKVSSLPAPALKSISKLADLDDPANPYRGKYGDWDRWVYKHVDLNQVGNLQNVVDISAEDCDSCGEEDSETVHTVLTTQVESGQYLVPILVTIEKYEEEVTKGTVGSNESTQSEENWIAATGLMSNSIKAALSKAEYKLRASYYSVVPDWLMVDVPESTMLLPNGDVMVNRPVRGGVGNNIPNADSGRVFYCYRADGSFRGATSQHWTSLYFTSKNINVTGDVTHLLDGTTEVADPDTGELLSRWNWDASPLPVDAGYESNNDRHSFQALSPFFVKALYANR